MSVRITVSFLVALSLSIAAQMQTLDTIARCGQTTVDKSAMFGPERAAKAKAFLVELQAAVKADDKQKIASMIRFPLAVSSGKAKPAFRKGREVMVTPSRIVASRDEFLAHYQRIMTAELKQDILRQRADCLFGNYQGAMIGSGVVWFDQSDGEASPFQVVTISIPDPK